MSFNVSEAINQISAATTAAQVLTLLSSATSHLPNCTTACIQAAGPDVFTQAGCSKFDTIVPAMDACVLKACPSANFDGIAEILNLQPIACLQLQQLNGTTTKSTWSIDDAAKQILDATNGTQVFSVLSESVTQLPTCVDPCLQAAAPELYSIPLSGEFFNHVCANFEATVTSIDSCITVGCHEETLQSIASVLNLQPLACLQLQHLTKIVAQASQANWTITDTAMGISAASTADELTHILNSAIIHLPECALFCLKSSVPKGVYAVPLTQVFFEFTCNNTESVVTAMDTCIQKECEATDFEGIQDILNLQPLGCLQFENLLNSA
ncbi:UNVERIFIED_CONTAM: hypothetical protein HDU68_006665 [Siphonaria sp. JEL0065]|nr:hypothetical protein HDU68_006665 [Siphonaria sp. JEL0065]